MQGEPEGSHYFLPSDSGEIRQPAEESPFDVPATRLISPDSAVRARGTTTAPCAYVMSISDRVTHVLSLTLIMVFASATAGWTSTERTTHCTQQTRSCTTRVSFTCCCPSAPIPIDRTQLPRLSTPPTHVSTASLMDDTAAALAPAGGPLPSTCWARSVDRQLLHRVLLI